jgi:hypothetical protein
MKKRILAIALLVSLCVNPFIQAEDISSMSKEELYKGIRSKTAKMSAMKRRIVKTGGDAQRIQSSLNELRDKEMELERKLKSELLKNPDYKVLSEQQMTYRNQLKVLKKKK